MIRAHSEVMAKTTTALDDATINDLARHEGSPAISIVFPLGRQTPGSTADPERIRAVGNQVRNELARALPSDNAERLSERVDAALLSIDLLHPRDAIGVFVADDLASVIPLDATVKSRIVVGDHFAVRELLHTAELTRLVHVIVVARGKTRCIDIRGEDAVEQFAFGFPVEVEAPTEADARRRNYPKGEREHLEEAEFVFRAVVDALADLGKDAPAPVVLVGTPRNIAFFDKIAGGAFDVAGRVIGDHEHDSIKHIAKLARAELEVRRHDQVVGLCADVHDAIGTGAVGGLAGVAAAVQMGRGRLLLVETDYQSNVGVDGHRVDRVEEAVREAVCHGGEVVEVDQGLLTDLGCIALFTRY